MIVVRLKGGLGNQMFQYALGRVLSLKNNTELLLDLSFFDYNFKHVAKRSYNLDVFNIKAETIRLSYLNSIIKKIFKRKGQEKSFQFDKNILSIGAGAYLDGYWQSPKYFEGFAEVIKKDFILKNSLPQNIQTLAEEIVKTNSLCIHIRRGDYVGSKFHEVINLEYYKKGIEYITQKKAIEKIYIFSDDINWCRKNMQFEISAMFMGDEYAGYHGEGHMFLMSLCKYFIIANSSFSWWGAWLSTYDNKIVICPRQWFGDASIDTTDLIPENWILI